MKITITIEDKPTTKTTRINFTGDIPTGDDFIADLSPAQRVALDINDYLVTLERMADAQMTSSGQTTIN
jgi:hypothetical protein